MSIKNEFKKDPGINYMKNELKDYGKAAKEYSKSVEEYRKQTQKLAEDIQEKRSKLILNTPIVTMATVGGAIFLLKQIAGTISNIKKEKISTLNDIKDVDPEAYSGNSKVVSDIINLAKDATDDELNTFKDVVDAIDESVQ